MVAEAEIKTRKKQPAGSGGGKGSGAGNVAGGGGGGVQNAGLAEEAAAAAPPPPPLTEAEKNALRREIALSDDYANEIGQEICLLLHGHRLRAQAAIRTFVDPQIDQLLQELSRSLDDPFA